MSPTERDHLLRVEELFTAAKALGAGERAEFLARACAGDGALREELDELLALDAGAGAFLDQPADPWLGRRLDRWRVLERLGAGGMGVVYLAERDDGAFRQRAALKLLKGGVDRVEALERFRRERQLLAGLEHPNIARLLDGGATEEGVPWLVMEYVEGTRLDRWCDERRAPLEQRLRLFLAVCGAVRHAHQRLIVHRDLKPSNVLVDAAGVPKLLDFGIAKLLEEGEAADDEATRTRERRLTPEYSSPEVVRGAEVTVASDVFSLGVMLHELLTGARPWRKAETTLSDLERAICDAPPPRPSACEIDAAGAAARGLDPARLRRALRGDLDAIVATALAAEPDRRYASVDRLAADVERHLAHQPIVARPPGAAYLIGKFVRRRRALVAALLVALLAVAAGVAGVASGAARARRHADATARVNTLLREMLVQLEPSNAQGFSRSLLKQLEYADAELAKGLLRDEPEIEIDLRIALGRVYGALGYAGWAGNQFREALLRAEATGVARDERMVKLLRWYGWSLCNAGRNDEGVVQLQRAIELADRVGGVPKERTAAASDLGMALTALQRFEEADALLREASERARASGATADASLAGVEIALALNALARGDLAGAEPAARGALELCRLHLPEADPRQAIGLDTLARVLRAQERFDDAEPLLERSLELRRELFDSKSPVIAWSLGLLADVQAAAGRPSEAVPLLEEALAIREQHYEKASFPQMETRLQLGLALLDSGEPEAALRHLAEAVRIADARRFVDPRLARGRTELARLLDQEQ